MDLVKATLILPLLPLFVVPLVLVAAAWIERGRRTRRTARPPAPG